jgi:hypothetical protein
MDNHGSRIGYVGDGSAGDRSVFLGADIDDVVLHTAAGRVLTATSGGNVVINGQFHINRSIVANIALLTMSVVPRPGDTTIFLCFDNSGVEIFGVHTGPTRQILMNADLRVLGNAFKSQGGATWDTVSDRRLKQDVRPYEPGLNEVLHLRPVRFRYRDDPKRGLTSAGEEVGFIAQEVREVIPDAVAEDKEGYLTLKADPIHWAAINAIQQLNTNLGEQRASSEAKDMRIAALERSVAELKAMVTALVREKGGAE